jgi:hypothetical protein
MIARFRVESSRSLHDPWFDQLLQDLLGSSVEFRRIWQQHEVQDTKIGAKSVHHATLGALQVDMVPLQIPDIPGAWLMVYMLDGNRAAHFPD